MAEQVTAWVQTFLAQRGDDALTIGGVLGVLAGAISFLFHALLRSKDQQIRELRKHGEADAIDRDFWRDVALGMARPSDKQAWLDARADAAHRRLMAPLEPPPQPPAAA